MQQATQIPNEIKKLFGTDGIRAKAGYFPLDNKTLNKIAEAISFRFEEKLGRKPKFIIGRDTRESGLNIEQIFISAINSMNGECVSAGVITTPGVAFLASEYGFDGGIVISASHNPYTDNGIKIFLPTGKKMGEELEQLIESDVANAAEKEIETERSDSIVNPEFAESYLANIKNKFPNMDLTGKKLVIDCANGAASNLAPELFRSYGAETVIINNIPDGRNINENCGSMHLGNLREKVLSSKADIGIAFDGDADRALFIDELGNEIDGDSTLWILTNSLISKGQLSDMKVVATVMSNVGLEIALNNIGVELIRTDVGDKYVLQELLKNGGTIGGEQSGHFIFPQYGLVGDGMLSASAVLFAMHTSGKALSELTAGFVKYPQVLYNVKVSQKIPFDQIPEISSAVAAVEYAVKGRGRLLLRYSGTENLVRIMLEGEDQDEIDNLAVSLGEVVKNTLG